MKPLQAIAMGLVVVVLQAKVGPIDLLVNPIGWLLVLLGIAHLPAALPHRATINTLAVLSLLISIPLVVPAVVDALDDADASIAWASNVPWLAFLAVLSHSLVAAAFDDEDRSAAAWWRLATIGALVLIALPVLVFGGGIEALEEATGIAVAVVPLYVIVLLFTHSGRPWAAEDPPTLDLSKENPGDHETDPP